MSAAEMKDLTARAAALATAGYEVAASAAGYRVRHGGRPLVAGSVDCPHVRNVTGKHAENLREAVAAAERHAAAIAPLAA